MSLPAIRPASLDDLDQIAALFDSYRQFYEQPPDLPLARRFIRARIIGKESVILLAEDGTRRAIGFCQLYPSFCSVIAAPILTLYDLFVIPGVRGAGTGRALLQAAHRHAADAGVARLDLTTARNNLPAQALYASLGWVRDEIFYTYNLAVKNDKT